MDCFFSGGMSEARLSELVASAASSCACAAAAAAAAAAADRLPSRSGIMSSSSVSVSVEDI